MEESFATTNRFSAYAKAQLMDSDDNLHSDIDKRSKWPLLRNVVRAVALFRNHEADEKPDINELIKEIQHIPTDNVYRRKRAREKESSPFHTALQDHRRGEKIFRCVERGAAEDLEEIKLELINDPYRYIQSISHPQSLINKRRDGRTPMYVACLHGNLDVIKLLLAEGADHLITSVVDGEEETSLQVAARWGHVRVVELLLEKCTWPKKIKQLALSQCNHKEIIEILKKSLNKKKRFCICFRR